MSLRQSREVPTQRARDGVAWAAALCGRAPPRASAAAAAALGLVALHLDQAVQAEGVQARQQLGRAGLGVKGVVTDPAFALFHWERPLRRPGEAGGDGARGRLGGVFVAFSLLVLLAPSLVTGRLHQICHSRAVSSEGSAPQRRVKGRLWGASLRRVGAGAGAEPVPLSGALLMLRGWEGLGMNGRLQCCVLLLLLWPLAGGWLLAPF